MTETVTTLDAANKGPAEEAEADGKSELKITDDNSMNESELEEIEVQLTSQDTCRQLAEFKARALNDLAIADRIRANQLNHQELLAYIDDESVLPQFGPDESVELPLPEQPDT